jgi:hypothetical protein
MSEVTNTTNDQQPTSQTAPGLSLQDLLMVVQTIQVVSQRGAIRADEMETVGGLYTRLVSFLQASGAIKSADAEQTAGADQQTAEQGE